jgi:hypothetical protein
MPREIAFMGIYVPTLLPLLLLAIVIHLGLEGVLARAGFFQHVWHPSLFRLCSFACLFAIAGLIVYS